MKKILFTFLILCGLSALSQTYSYKIKFQGVTTPDAAKPATDFIRLMFKCNTSFNDTTDTFTFISSVSLDNVIFSQNSINSGYFVILFDKQVSNTEIIYKEEGDN